MTDLLPRTFNTFLGFLSVKINESNDLSIDTQFGKFEPRWNSFQSKRHLFSLIYYYQRKGLSNLELY